MSYFPLHSNEIQQTLIIPFPYCTNNKEKVSYWTNKVKD